MLMPRESAVMDLRYFYFYLPCSPLVKLSHHRPYPTRGAGLWQGSWGHPGSTTPTEFTNPVPKQTDSIDIPGLLYQSHAILYTRFNPSRCGCDLRISLVNDDEREVCLDTSSST
jgi:hypothetical protein